MRILLTSDWHIGKTLFSKNLLEEQAKFFEDTFFACLKDVKPDLLINAGDIFDRPIPDLDSLRLFEEIIKRLFEGKVKSLFILGNHDSRRASIHSDLLRMVGIIIARDLTYFFNPLTLDSLGTKIHLYVLPYLSLREYEEEVEGQDFENTADFIKSLLKNWISYIKKPAILVSHLAVSGTVWSDEELPLKGLSREYLLPLDCFSAFDLVLLGHLHSPQVHQGKFIYPGSPLPYSFDLLGKERGVTLLEIKDGKVSHLERIKLPSPYELKVYVDYFENLKRLPQDRALVKVVLKDKQPIYEVEKELRKVFPNLLTLVYEEDERRENFPDFLSFLDEDKATPFELEPISVFKNFYKHIVGRELEEEVWQVFNKYYQKFVGEVERYGY
jgi:exonuclease SbcD